MRRDAIQWFSRSALGPWNLFDKGHKLSKGDVLFESDLAPTADIGRRDEELAELQAVLGGARKFADLPPRV